jgi:RNA polymerase sigma factor (sigma-70 family)
MSHLARHRPPTTAIEEDFEFPDTRPGPEQVVSNDEQRRRLFEGVQRLPVGYRQVMMLALEGMTYGEIGDVLGISESNVGARLTRAREALRRSMQ